MERDVTSARQPALWPALADCCVWASACVCARVSTHEWLHKVMSGTGWAGCGESASRQREKAGEQGIRFEALESKQQERRRQWCWGWITHRVRVRVVRARVDLGFTQWGKQAMKQKWQTSFAGGHRLMFGGHAGGGEVHADCKLWCTQAREEGALSIQHKKNSRGTEGGRKKCMRRGKFCFSCCITAEEFTSSSPRSVLHSCLSLQGSKSQKK